MMSVGALVRWCGGGKLATESADDVGLYVSAVVIGCCCCYAAVFFFQAATATSAAFILKYLFMQLFLQVA